MIKTPSDFNKISKIEESDRQSLLLSLICPCGKQDFSILINTNDPNLPKKEELFDSLIKNMEDMVIVIYFLTITVEYI